MEDYISKLKCYCQSLDDCDNVIIDNIKPSYLRSFDMDEQCTSDVIFIRKLEKLYTADNDMSVLRQYSEARSHVHHSEMGFELGGQPLQDPFDESVFHEDTTLGFFPKKVEIEEYSHAPLTCADSRSILTFANMVMKQNIPIWILNEPSEIEDKILLGSSFVNDWASSYWITLLGPEAQDLSAQDMVKYHNDTIQLKNSRVDAEVLGVFRVLSDDAEKTDNIGTGKILMKVTWNKPTIKIPITGASMEMVLEATVGLELSNIYVLWEQLLLLQSYFDILTRWKNEDTYPVAEQKFKFALPHSKFVDRLGDSAISEKIINALICPEQWYIKKDTSNKLSEILTDIVNGETPGLDLTDRLWLVLSECATYKDLTTNVTLIFQQAKKSTVKSYLSNENKTRMAEAVRMVLNDHAANPHMMLEPLQLLIEIGIQKLKKDYITMLSQSMLAKEESLCVPKPPSFTVIDGATWFETVSMYLTWMSKIHATMELICVAQSCPNIKSMTIVSITQQAVDIYLGRKSPINSLSHLQANPLVKLTIPIAKHAFSIPQEPQYDKWLLTLTTKSENCSLTTQYLRTSKPTFPVTVQDRNLNFSDVTLDSTSCLQKTPYFCSRMTTMTYHLIKNKKIQNGVHLG